MAALELLALVATLATQGSAAPQTPPPAPQVESIWERLRFYGNGRLRAESTFDQPSGEDRHRGRLRLRAGATFEIMEDLTSEARVSTASDGNDANNPHWDFGDGADGFQGSGMVLDRLFLNWKALDTLNLRGGKFPHAFTTPPVFSEFTWDADIQPAGVAATWKPKGDLDFDLRAVDYVVAENANADDPNMFGVQGNLGLELNEASDLRFATSVQWWTSLGDLPAATFGNQGNTTTGGVLNSEFTIWDSHAAFVHEGGIMGQQQAFVQYVNNVDDDLSEDTAIMAGFELGRSKAAGDNSIFAAIYDTDANAFYSAVAQDDTPIAGTGAGTGMTGVMAGWRRILNDKVSIRLWGLTSDADVAEDPWRVRFDIDFNIK
jgi:hypothetical protein